MGLTVLRLLPCWLSSVHPQCKLSHINRWEQRTEFAEIVQGWVQRVKPETKANRGQQFTHLSECENGFRDVDPTAELWHKTVSTEAHYIMARYVMLVGVEMLPHITKTFVPLFLDREEKSSWHPAAAQTEMSQSNCTVGRDKSNTAEK